MKNQVDVRNIHWVMVCARDMYERENVWEMKHEREHTRRLKKIPRTRKTRWDGKKSLLTFTNVIYPRSVACRWIENADEMRVHAHSGAYKKNNKLFKKINGSTEAIYGRAFYTSLSGCVSSFCGEWRMSYHSLVTLMILLYIYFTEMASKWQKRKKSVNDYKSKTENAERWMYHSVGLVISNCTFTRYIRWTEKKKLWEVGKNLQTTVRRTAIERSNKDKCLKLKKKRGSQLYLIKCVRYIHIHLSIYYMHTYIHEMYTLVH